MARWFWYVSGQKLGSLKSPKKGWGFLRQRLDAVDIEAGVPWAKFTSKGAPDPSLVHSIEDVERDIRRDHRIAQPADCCGKGAPLFFEFEGQAGRLILRESYKGQEGECVFLMVGIQGRTGVILLGSGANVFGSTSARPRFIDPSVDPAGALLVLVDETTGDFYRNRAGVARDAYRLPPDERVLYSFASTLDEAKRRTFSQRVRALAIFSAHVPVHGRHTVNEVKLPEVDDVVIGSPVYVEQMDSAATDV